MQPMCLFCIQVSPSVTQRGDRMDILHSKRKSFTHSSVCLELAEDSVAVSSRSGGPNKTGRFKIITIMQI